MNKHLKIICLLAFMLSFSVVVSIVIFAHSGKTDYSGGHYNHSTGDYHYHHGYSAHDHYDMDGDGDLDCPYTFKDKTNNGNSSNSTNEKAPNKSNTSKGTHKDEKNETTFWDVVCAFLLLIPASLVTLLCACAFLGLLEVSVIWFIKKHYGICIEDSKVERILRISVIIALVILLPLEFVFILGIL